MDASGNDGDRGVLIASFAEALVLDGNPHDYITLLDRIVDDYDNLFDGKTLLLLLVGYFNLMINLMFHQLILLRKASRVHRPIH